MSASKRYALVTGCSEGGMGWYMAREFAKHGIHTFATLRTVSKAGSLVSMANVEVLELDVTSTESIRACVKQVEDKTGGRLDYLYNNAGAQLVMPLADTDLAEARRNFDVNVWSILEVTQAFLPLLVAAGGHVSNAGSIRADLYQEYDGVYGMSKAAITKLSENMRFEFAPLGVSVSCVHIGAIKTHIWTNQPTAASLGLPESSYYKSIESNILAIGNGSRTVNLNLTEPDVFARKTVGDILAGKTGDIWRGKFATLTRVMRMCPTWVLESFLGADSGLPALAKERRKAKKYD